MPITPTTTKSSLRVKPPRSRARRCPQVMAKSPVGPSALPVSVGKIVADLPAIAGGQVEPHVVAVADSHPKPPVGARRQPVGQLVLAAQDAVKDVLAVRIRPQRVAHALVRGSLEPSEQERPPVDRGAGAGAAGAETRGGGAGAGDR